MNFILVIVLSLQWNTGNGQSIFLTGETHPAPSNSSNSKKVMTGIFVGSFLLSLFLDYQVEKNYNNYVKSKTPASAALYREETQKYETWRDFTVEITISSGIVLTILQIFKDAENKPY